MHISSCSRYKVNFSRTPVINYWNCKNETNIWVRLGLNNYQVQNHSKCVESWIVFYKRVHSSEEKRKKEENVMKKKNIEKWKGKKAKYCLSIVFIVLAMMMATEHLWFSVCHISSVLYLPLNIIDCHIYWVFSAYVLESRSCLLHGSFFSHFDLLWFVVICCYLLLFVVICWLFFYSGKKGWERWKKEIDRKEKRENN